MIQTAPKNWNDLPHLMATHELTLKDDTCLSELQKVIEKHGLTEKFRVALLHKHFDIGNDEVLLESNDPLKKTLSSVPMKVSENMSQEYATTLWRFDDGMRYGCAFCKKDHCDTEDMK